MPEETKESEDSFAKRIFFPYEQIRPIQDEMLKDFDKALSEKKHMIMHAPTGIGKTSVLGPAIARVIEYNKKLDPESEEKMAVVFLTSRHTQHLIALETCKKVRDKYQKDLIVADIIGKQCLCAVSGISQMNSNEFAEYCREMKKDHKCEYYAKTRKSTGKLTVEGAVAYEGLLQRGVPSSDEVISTAALDKLCPYELSAELAKKASVIIADYYHAFHPRISEGFWLKTGKAISRTILIVDEGHNLGERIRNLASAKLTSYMCLRAIKEAKKEGYEDVVGYVVQLQNIINSLSSTLKLKEEQLVKQDDFFESANKIKKYDELLTDMEFYGEEIREKHKQSFVAGIASFLLAWQGQSNGFARIINLTDSKGILGVSLSYRCLDPSVISGSIISDSYCTLLMSATLTPTEMYKDILGFPKETILESYDSPFPPENKLSLIVPRTTTKFTARNEEQYKEQATIVADIVNSIRGNSLVFFPSYYLRDRIYTYLASLCEKTTFLERAEMSKGEKQEFLEKFKGYATGHGACMLAVASGSFGEGVDLPDTIKCVVVVGLPLSQPDLETQELIKYYDQKFGKGWDYGYIYPAMNKVVQAAGRCIRSGTDKGVIVFLDQRFTWQSYYKCFPRDWRIKVRMEYKADISEFWKNHSIADLTKV